MKKAFFCAPGELSMSLLMKCGETWGWKESFKIKFPLQLGLWVLFFFNCFWEEHSGAEPGFLWNTSKWLWIPIYNFLCLTCVISGVQSLWGLKSELRDFQNANKRAKYNILPMVRCVIATRKSSFHLWKLPLLARFRRNNPATKSWSKRQKITLCSSKRDVFVISK